MSNQQTFSSNRMSPPSTPEDSDSDSDTSSLPSGVYYCSCGMPDAFENWIYCDNDNCPIRWYHWECVSVTAKPCGYWLCPRCSSKSTTNIQERRGATKTLWSKTAKRTVRDRENAVDDERKDEAVAASKTPVRPRKGIAVKKAPSKTRSKWVGWAETDSEGEDGDEEETKRAQRARGVAKTRRTMARATKSQGRLAKSGAVHKTSKTASGASKKMRIDVPQDVDEVKSNHAEAASRAKDSRAKTTPRGKQNLKVRTVTGITSSPSSAKDILSSMQSARHNPPSESSAEDGNPITRIVGT